jgi:hypothetical protein
MRKPSRGRGGAAHAGGARGVTPRAKSFLFRAEQRKSDAQPYAHFMEGHSKRAAAIFDTASSVAGSSEATTLGLPAVAPMKNDALLALAALAAHRSALLRPHPKRKEPGGTPPMPPVSFCTFLRRCSGMPRRCARWNGVILSLHFHWFVVPARGMCPPMKKGLFSWFVGGQKGPCRTSQRRGRGR